MDLLGLLKEIFSNTHGITPQGGGVPLSQIRQLAGDPGAMPGVSAMAGPTRQNLIGLLRWLERNTDQAKPGVVIRRPQAFTANTALDNFSPDVIPERRLPADVLPSTVPDQEKSLVDFLRSHLGPRYENLPEGFFF